ncbi:hypothetical protein SCLCIDRAFT_26166 [Scleroderma citrinum Foug A]|uniref:Extracellular membrane protein CFEM domain-containing protein n=1 Tax=Scleroderma citrinum Foug A TaxID=1036808 RepID=A0A0C3DYM9_9AGAM|nr:hypothetical protein SCLCIDRAFT_26166 [Scleroderma citrinum Foug A]
MVATLPLISTFAVIGQLHNAQRDVSNALGARQTGFDPSQLPSQCQSSCSVITQMSSASCETDLSCLCSSSISSGLQSCMTCLVKAEPSVESSASGALTSYNEACGTSLSIGSSSGGSSGGSSSGGSSSASASSPSSTSTSGGSSSGSSGSSGSSSPLASKSGDAVGLRMTVGGLAAGIAAALLGAFMGL